MPDQLRPPTRVELDQLAAACDRADREHVDMVLASGGTQALDPPVVAVPVEVFGVDELTVVKLREKLDVWAREPPPIPPAFVGLRPRRTR